uniref:Uncharacterized protein n=1 Tax=Panagrellus redivivus TaxID=6233 RepID=A0A7E4V4V5_PANRE
MAHIPLFVSCVSVENDYIARVPLIYLSRPFLSFSFRFIPLCVITAAAVLIVTSFNVADLRPWTFLTNKSKQSQIRQF